MTGFEWLCLYARHLHGCASFSMKTQEPLLTTAKKDMHSVCWLPFLLHSRLALDKKGRLVFKLVSKGIVHANLYFGSLFWRTLYIVLVLDKYIETKPVQICMQMKFWLFPVRACIVELNRPYTSVLTLILNKTEQNNFKLLPGGRTQRN